MLLCDRSEYINAFRHWENYHNPLWSPDDTKLAYYRGVTNMVAMAGMEELYNCTSTGPERLCPGNVIYDLITDEYLSLDMVEGISFSPDSRRIALFRDCTWGWGKSCVELSPESETMRLFGNNFGFHVLDLPTRRVVYTDPAAVLDNNRSFSGNAFQWSPDGQSLCYPLEISSTKDDFRPQGKLRITRLDTSDQKVNLSGLTCAWAPDSRHISYVAYPSSRYYTTTQTGKRYAIYRVELHIYDLSTREDRVLFAQEVLSGFSQFDHVEWSPDGKYIAFTFTPFSGEILLEKLPRWKHPDYPDLRSRVIVVEVATGRYWQLKDLDAGSVHWRGWSPDSTHLRFLGSESIPYYDSFYLEIAVP